MDVFYAANNSISHKPCCLIVTHIMMTTRFQCFSVSSDKAHKCKISKRKRVHAEGRTLEHFFFLLFI